MCLKGESIAEVPFKLFWGSHTLYVHTYIYIYMDTSPATVGGTAIYVVSIAAY